MSDARSHTLVWHDPSVGPKAARSMAGIEYLRAMRDGSLPPPAFVTHLDLQFEEVESGHVVFSALPQEFHLNPVGVVHGGFASWLLDSALGCATLSLLPAGMVFTTLDLHVNFVRAITPAAGRLRGIGDVVHGGRTVVTSFGKILDDAGKLYAHATSTCMVLPWPSD